MKMIATVVEIARTGKTYQLVLNVELVPNTRAEGRSLAQVEEGDLLAVDDFEMTSEDGASASILPS